MSSPDEKKNYMMTEDIEVQRTPTGMFDNNLRMSKETEDYSPGLRGHAVETFGEGQMDLKGLRGSA